MRWISVIAFVIAFHMQGRAQMQFNPDLYFFLTFTSSDGTITNTEISGTCYYYRLRHEPTPVSTAPQATNELEVVIQTTAEPKSLWMLEKKTNGTFIPLTEITNRSEHDYYDLHYYDYSQNLRLTKKQILRLLDGNFYAQIELSNGSNYVSQLTNDFRFASGPTPVIRLIGPVFYTNPAAQNIPVPNYVLIATDNQQADVAFDGLKTADPFFLPMRFQWTGYQGSAFWDLHPVFTNSHPILIRSFGLGICGVSLQASDTIATGSVSYATFSVITPSQAVNNILKILQSANLSEYRYKILAGCLQNAASYFEQGNTLRGCDELDRFIKQARTLRNNDQVFDLVFDLARRLRNTFQ